MSFLSKILMIFTFFVSLSACAESPNAVVPAGEPEESAQEVGLRSLKFTGDRWAWNFGQKKYIDTGKACSFYLSLLEEESEHHFVVQVAETIHGQKLKAMELEKYYNTDAGYVSEKPDSGTFSPSLVALEMLDENAEADINKIADYAGDFTLEQSFELSFNQDLDFEAMESEMESIIESKSEKLTAKSLTTMNKMADSIAYFHHSGHTDDYDCRNIQLEENTELKEYTFEGGHTHDDDDHSHDHGDQ